MARSTAERKAALLEKRKALDAQLRDLQARESAATRKLDTRRKIVLGGAVMAHCGHDADFADAVRKALRSALTNERDKEETMSTAATVARTESNAIPDLDALYELPFMRLTHPSYTGKVPGFATIKDSVIVSRGCAEE